MKSSLYYECHITTEVIPHDKREQFDKDCKEFGFWASDWKLADTSLKFFATSRDTDLENMRLRMDGLMRLIKSRGIMIWRYKIEDTIIDSKIIDCLGLVDKFQSSTLEDFDKVGVR